MPALAAGGGVVGVNAGCTASSCPRTEYWLTGPAGMDSPEVALNGLTLRLDPETGKLPPLVGRPVAGSTNVIELPPATIVFVVFAGAGHVAGCGQFAK